MLAVIKRSIGLSVFDGVPVGGDSVPPLTHSGREPIMPCTRSGTAIIADNSAVGAKAIADQNPPLNADERAVRPARIGGCPHA